ncbi:hypothetical protein PLESTM_001814900 [Pleodorina starrii]|nr:hypothetical protein PLESTM_001814900 [Pleodorina starrii]
MSGLLAIAALTAAGAMGIRRLVLARRNSSETSSPAGSADTAPIDPVTPDAADRTVTIVDNGGRPFVVRLSYKRRVATVYLVRWLDDETKDDTSHVLRSFHFRRAFIGLDPREPRLENEPQRTGGAATASASASADSGAAGQEQPQPQPERIWWHGGNSVLLDLGGRRYVFIGLVIYAFTAYDDIHEYVSKMGNNAVPYPYAVGAKNTYFMIEFTYIPNHIVKLNRPEDEDDPYRVLYNENLCRWLPGVDPKQPLPVPMTHYSGGSWTDAFKLKDYELLCNRQW